MSLFKRTRQPEVECTPIGTSADEDRRRRAAGSIEYRKAQEQHATTRELAWQLIRYRMEQGISQQELADRVGTSFSQISRLENGRYMPSSTTLQRLATAMDRDLKTADH